MMLSVPLRISIVHILALAVVGCHSSPSSVTAPTSRLDSQANYPVGTIELNPGGGWNGVGGTLKGLSNAIPASKSIAATVNARLMNTANEPLKDGTMELKLTFQSGSSLEDKQDAAGGDELEIAVPLSSSADAYGESRSCAVLDNGHIHFSYTAGLDEQNFVSFLPMDKGRDFQFSVNKFLCRALAAPFTCRGNRKSRQIQLSADMSKWQLRIARVDLHGPSAAKAEISKLTLTSTGRPFDYATCAKIAPSDGLCCVSHKETAWHCGTRPEGKGWHQVSGSCYHRETGAACSD